LIVTHEKTLADAIALRDTAEANCGRLRRNRKRQGLRVSG
jgi:hypothetical protein